MTPPRLLSGPEQDVILRELLAGHARGDAPAPPWPEHVLVALDKRGFRAELRDLLMRAVEHGLEADRLAALGAEHGRPEWVAAAQVLREYDEVTAFSRPGAYDPAWILGAAADLLEDDADGAGEGGRAGAARRRRRRPGAHLRRGPAAPGASPPPGPTSSSSATRTRRSRRSAAPTPASWPTAGPTSADATRRAPSRRRSSCAPHTGSRRRSLDVSRTDHDPHRGARPAVAQRAPEPLRAGGDVEVRLLRSPAQEAAHIAARLRAAHLLDGVPWCEMAVVVRSEGRDEALRRVLMAHGVPDAAVGQRGPGARRGRGAPVAGARRHGPLGGAGARTPSSTPSGRRPRAVAARWSATRSGCAGCAGCCAATSWTAGAGGPATSCCGRSCSNPVMPTALGPRPPRSAAVAKAIDAGAARSRHGRRSTDGVRTWAPGVSAETVLWAVWERPRRGRRAGAGWPCAVASGGRAPTATSTPSSGCSTRRSATSTGSRRPGRTRSSSTSRGRTSPATPSSRGLSRATASPC